MKFEQYSDEEILQIAKERDDLWEYDNDCLLNRVRNCYQHHWDIDDCLDEFSHLED